MRNKENTKLIEPSGEEKAFVYQQALELSPFLAQSGKPIAVILEKNQNHENHLKYFVTFILAPEDFNIKIQSEGDNLFDACKSATDKAKNAIRQLINHQESPIRKMQMEHFKKFPYLQ